MHPEENIPMLCTVWEHITLQGLKEEAEYYYDLQIEYCLRDIEVRSGGSYYDLASAYAVKGETDKALENLRIWMINQRTIGMNVGVLKNGFEF
jgi:hypothetical protein